MSASAGAGHGIDEQVRHWCCWFDWGCGNGIRAGCLGFITLWLAEMHDWRCLDGCAHAEPKMTLTVRGAGGR